MLRAILVFLLVLTTLSGIAFSQESAHRGAPTEGEFNILRDLVDTQTGEHFAGVFTMTSEEDIIIAVHPAMNMRGITMGKIPLFRVVPVGSLYGIVLSGPQDPPEYLEEYDPGSEGAIVLGVYATPEVMSDLPGSPMSIDGYLAGFQPLAFELSLSAGLEAGAEEHNYLQAGN